MAASFTLTLDTQAPSHTALLIEEGAAQTGTQDVSVSISTPSTDVTQMKVWGDVDPAADLAIQVAEADSTWLPYAEALAIRLSAGTGRKYLYARLRDDVGNVSLPFQDFIDFDPTLPVVDITTAVDRSRISKTAPYDAATFIWEASLDFVHYEVRVVPSHGSPHQAGVLIPVAGGSLNTSGSGAFIAETPITTTIRGADLEAASPGDTPKIVKVFVRTAAGTWSA